jgi:hypothetical protein
MPDDAPRTDTDEARLYDEWNRGYQARGELLKSAISITIQDALTADRLDAARSIVRQRRARFPHKFCLLLYGSGPDEAIAAQIRAAMESPPTDEEWRQALKTVGRPGRNSTVLTLLMTLLDVDGIHTVMLEPESETPPDGPLRIRAPEHFWFASFGLIAELAHAVLVIGNIGANLIRETRYLADAGLDGRVLLYAGTELYEFDSSKAFEDQRTWPLSTDGLREALAHASSAAARPPMIDFATSVFGDAPSPAA